MPVSILQQAENLVVSSGANNVTLPGPTTAGSFIAAWILQGTGLTRTFSLAGFTEQRNQEATATRSMKLRYKQNESAGVTVYTVNVGSGLTATFSVVIYELAGVDPTTPFASDLGQRETAATSHTIASAGQNIDAGDLWLGAAMCDASASWGALTFSTVTVDYTTAINSASRVNASWLPGSSQVGFTGPFSVGTSRATFSIGAVIKAAAAAGGGPFPHHLRRALAGGMCHGGARGGLI
jgi:hypothetical protein